MPPSSGAVFRALIIQLATCLAGIIAICAKNIEITGKTVSRQEWLYGHGTNLGEHVFEGLQARDGGFIAVGKTGEKSGRTADILVVKTDAKGKLEWQRIIGEKGRNEEGRCIIEVEDGYVLGGALTLSGKTKAGLMKLDRNGRTVWSRIHDHSGHGAIRGIDLTSDRGIVATGYTDSRQRAIPFIADEARGFILKTDSKGEISWKKPLRVTQGTKVRADKHNGGFVICSTTWTFTSGKDHQDACLIKTDNHGNVTWTKFYGGPGQDQCFDMDLTANGYVLAGHTTSSDNRGWNAWLVRIGNKGELMWEKSFGEPLGGDPGLIYDECYGVRTTHDGGFIMACGSGIEPENVKNRRDPRNIWAAYVIRTDAKGNIMWEFTHHTPGEGHNAAEYITQCKDRGFMVFMDSDNAGSMKEENFGFLKLAPEKSIETTTQPKR